MAVKNDALILKANDPKVIAAVNAEQQLFNFYGIKAKAHFIPLPGLGIRIRVSETGSGKPVLVVPGNTGDGFPLAPLLAELTGRRIILFNRPGGGLSEGIDHNKVDFRAFATQTLTAVLDAFGLDSCPIIAHSIGGHWSLWMAMDKPQRVSALVLLGVPGNIINTSPPLLLRLLSVPVLNRLLFALVTPRSAKQSLRGLSFMGHSPETIARLPQAMAECYYHFQKLPHYKNSSLSLMEQANKLSGSKRGIKITEAELNEVLQPVMFLWGTNDPFGSIEKGRFISKSLPSSQFHAIKGGGHLPWLDEPSACGGLILDFLSGY